MKSPLAFLIVIVLFAFVASAAEAQTTAVVYKIVVESVGGRRAAPVEFTGAYAAYDGSHHAPLTHIRKLTPFTASVPGTDFLGLFQAVAADVSLKVTLRKFENGKETAHADGAGILNLVYGKTDRIGYGLPTERGGSTIEDMLEPQRSK